MKKGDTLELDVRRPWAVGIPLLSSRVAKDWRRATTLLERTLRSLAAQKHCCSRVWIACHEQPDLRIPDNLNVSFVEVAFPPPRFTIEMEVDKLRKLEVIAGLHRKQGAGFLYLLDADDLLDSCFSEYILASKAKAVLVGRGYQLNAQTGNVTELPRFWRRCGSCAVVDWSIEDLPQTPLSDTGSVFRKFLDTRHFLWHSFFAEKDWLTEILKVPAVMYVVNHGQNDSEHLSRFSWRWRLYNRLWPGHMISDGLAQRFSLSPSDVCLSGRDGAGFNVGYMQRT